MEDSEEESEEDDNLPPETNTKAVEERKLTSGDLSDGDFMIVASNLEESEDDLDALNNDLESGDDLDALNNELTKEDGSHSKQTESEIDNEPNFLSQLPYKTN